MKIEVYTDGSATTRDLPGGWAFVVLVDGTKTHEASGHLSKATNNVAEITAAIEGLSYVAGMQGLVGSDEIVLVSDSQLVLKYATGEYKCKAFHLAPLFIKLRNLHGQLNLKTRWVKGHSGDTYNEQCDKLAKSARQNPAGPSSS